MFSDKLTAAITRSGSRVCAGFDPLIDTFPAYILETAARSNSSNEQAIFSALTGFFRVAFEAVAAHIAAVKPNLAFFEQYGIAGLRAYLYIRDLARAATLPCIADAKRGDIGSTAAAYGRAFLQTHRAFGKEVNSLSADALTINPFLGFETLEPFLAASADEGRGLFVLVRTSNPGSADIQDACTASAQCNVSQAIAQWIAENCEKLRGQSGWSGLGAVVGATHPRQLAELRAVMKTSYFLVPGLGAQGAKTSDITKAFAKDSAGAPGGALINISRALFSQLPQQIDSDAKLGELLQKRVAAFNTEINAATLSS